MAPIQIPDVLLFTPGRACAGPLAVVLHEWNGGIESLDAAMQRCPRRRPAQSPGCHTSFHFGIGGDCHFHQYVAIGDTAWGFGVTVPTCPAPICPPDPCASCTGLTVDQYQTDLDGNPPVLPALVAGPDGTANCGVIHVAVPILFPINPGISDGPCCAPNERAYLCLVNALCQIFQLSGLTPTQSTLLVHCGEHECLDIDQLVVDVLACINTPPPPPIPCQCTPTPVQFCAAVAEVPVGPVAVPGVTALLGADCLTHVLPAVVPVDVTIVGVDTATIDITVIEAPANTFTISADAIADPDFLCEQISTLEPQGDVGLAVQVVGIIQGEPGTICGLFNVPVLDVAALDTATVDTTVSLLGGVATVSSDVIVSPDAGNQLVVQPNGLFVPSFTLTDCAGAAVLSGSEVITPANLFNGIPTNTQVQPDIVVAPATDSDCSRKLAAPIVCAAVNIQDTTHVNFNSGHWVLASRNDQDAGTPTWRKLGAGFLLGGDTGASSINVNNLSQSGVRYVSTDAPQTINVPNNDCARTELYIKNVGAAPITITGIGTTIDGVAAITLDGTVPAGYPFGNNGGESVHLVWNPGRAEWQVF